MKNDNNANRRQVKGAADGQYRSNYLNSKTPRKSPDK